MSSVLLHVVKVSSNCYLPQSRAITWGQQRSQVMCEAREGIILPIIPSPTYMCADPLAYELLSLISEIFFPSNFAPLSLIFFSLLVESKQQLEAALVVEKARPPASNV